MARGNLIQTVLLVLAFVCFAIAAWQPVSPIYNRMVAVGLAALSLSLILA
jgi:hypothetical protein